MGLVDLWNAFAAASETATSDEKMIFRNTISPREYTAAYPNLAVKLSFLNDTAASIEKGIISIVSSSRCEDNGFVSNARQTSIKKHAKAIASTQTPIQNARKFRECAENTLTPSAIARYTSVFVAIANATDTGEIIWATPTGLPTPMYTQDEHWTRINTMTQYERRVVSLCALRNPRITKTNNVPTRRDLPLYILRKDEQQQQQQAVPYKNESITTYHESAVFNAISIESTETDGDIARKAIANMATHAGEGVHKLRNSIYVVAICDEYVPRKHKWQLYFGKAEAGVWSRWGAKDPSSHMSRIQHIVQPNIRENEPHAQLVDIVLSRIWVTHGTWHNHVFIGIYETGIENMTTSARESELIKTYHTTDPRFGMNQKV